MKIEVGDIILVETFHGSYDWHKVEKIGNRRITVFQGGREKHIRRDDILAVTCKPQSNLPQIVRSLNDRYIQSQKQLKQQHLIRLIDAFGDADQ